MLGTAWHGPWAGQLRAAFRSRTASLKPGPEWERAIQAAVLRGQPASRLAVCWCEMWEMEARTAGATPMAAEPQQAASYVQFITEEEDSGSAGRPATPLGGSQAGTVHVHGGEAYKGPLNWFPDRCCRMEGLELAASPSFLQTTCGERRDVTAGPPQARQLACAHIPEPWTEGGEGGD